MHWRPMDIIILLLTLTLCVVVGFTVVIPLMFQADISETKSKMISATVGSMVSIVSLYIGAKIQEHKDK